MSLNPQELLDLINRYERVQFAVHKKSQLLVKDLIKQEAGVELTADQHSVLRYINREKRCTSSQLSDIFLVNKSAITAIINRLVTRRFIKRERDELDRRVVYLTLTEEGFRLFSQCEKKAHEFVGSMIKQFEEEEIGRFLTTYEKLNTILEETISQKKEGETN